MSGVLHALRVLKNRRQTQEQQEILYYPAFSTMEELVDQIYRIAWYVPENSGVIVKIFIDSQLANNLKSDLQVLLKRPSYFMSLPEQLPSNVLLINNATPTKIKDLAKAASLLAIWENSKLDELAEIKKLGRRVLIVDKNDDSRLEPFSYAKILFDITPWQIRHTDEQNNKRLLEQLKDRWSHYQKAYVFGTGPSLKEAFDYDFSDGFRIVCNSIVKNKSLMEHIKPHMIVAGDPLFHFGCSKYAEAFRKSLHEALEAYDSTYACQHFYSYLLKAHFSDIAKRSLFVPTQRADLFNLDLSNNFIVKGTENILTLLLLPLASTMSDNIYILGCDGRKPDEDYFWQHDKASQFNNLMDDIKLCHPGFFDNVVYEDYYAEHCAQLESFFKQGEQVGKSFYSLTTSYIPALEKRATLKVPKP